MAKGSQGYFGELYLQNNDSFINKSFIKIGTVQEFSLRISVKIKEISTIGFLLKNNNYRNFESIHKSWSLDFRKISIDTDESETLLENAIDNNKSIWVKIIPRYKFTGPLSDQYRFIFVGRGLLVSSDKKNSLTTALNNGLNILGTGAIFKLKEHENGIIDFETGCLETALANGCDFASLEYSDLYTSLSCSGGWSEPVYISTSNTPSHDWIESSCVASIRKSVGYFGCGLGDPPTGRTTATPEKPEIAVPLSCYATSVLGKIWGNEIGDEVSLSGPLGPVYNAKRLYDNNVAGFLWFPSSPNAPSAVQLCWASSQTCDAQWSQVGYDPPPFGGNFGATVPGYAKYLADNGKLEAITEGMANDLSNSAGSGGSDGVTIYAVPPNTPDGNCVVDSGACTFEYHANMMLTNGAHNHSIDLSIKFYSDALGANLLATFAIPNYNIHSGVTWTDTNLSGAVPIGARYWSLNIKFNNPNLLNYIYGYVVEYTGMRFFY